MAKNSLEIESKVSRKNGKISTPAYFLSLTVENVRCFGPKQTLDLSNGEGRPAQWTIILGNNGVGKTTLLQTFIALMPFDLDFGLQEEDGKEIKYFAAKFGADKTMSSEWKPFRYGSGNENYYLSAKFFQVASLASSEIGKEVQELYVGRNDEASLKGLNLKKGNILRPELLGDVVCFAYGATRRMGETSLSEKAEDDPYASLFSDNVELLNAEEWLLQADYAASKPSHVQKRAAKRRDDIKDVLINLLPDVEDIRFAQLTEKQMKPGVEVKTPYGWVSIKDLSLGYKTLIAWMVDLASRLFDRYPDSRNPLAEPAVVLVDEIDLHLHPKWQRNLMSFLSERFPNTQFIATAHSPLVVQAATDANIVLLRREGDHVIIDNDVKKIHGWRVDQVLTSDLFGLESARPPQLDNLLAERTKILSKAKLTKRDKDKLEKLEAEIGALPTGETPADMEAMDVIRRAAEKLKAEGY